MSKSKDSVVKYAVAFIEMINMSYIPPQEYELGTVWVPMYLNGQIFMIPIRPKPIQPINPKPYIPGIPPGRHWDTKPSKSPVGLEWD